MESEYMALTLGLADELFSGIQLLLATYKLRLLPSLTVYDANRLLSNQIFHLLIINLEYLKSVQQIEWLTGVRRISFAPLIVLSDAPDLDLHSMVELGADICAPSKGPHSIIADLAHAQLRRYTDYNHYDSPNSSEDTAFRVGDIYIDPPRRIVKVRGQHVELKRREFFSELTNRELSCLQYMDYYALEQTTFRVLDTTIKIADERLSRALEDLSQERREVILLSYLLDMKDREIAEQLGLSLSTVQYRRSSTLEKLRKIMEGFKNG